MFATTKHSESLSARCGHSGCFLCGDLNPKSLHLSFEVLEDGSVQTRFEANHELQGFEGILHGGVVASLLDAAMTHCLFHQGVQAVTGDLHIRYVKPVPCSASMEVSASVLSCRPPLYLLKAELIKDKQVLAWAEAKFMQRC